MCAEAKIITKEEAAAAEKREALANLFAALLGWACIIIGAKLLIDTARTMTWNEAEKEAEAEKRRAVGMAAGEAYEQGVLDGRADAARILAKRDAEKPAGKTKRGSEAGG